MTTADEMSDLDSQSSTCKMSIDSDDSSSYKSSLRDMAVSNWANTVERNNIREEDTRRTHLNSNSRRDPERRTVNRRSSLLVSLFFNRRVIDKVNKFFFTFSQNQKRY